MGRYVRLEMFRGDDDSVEMLVGWVFELCLCILIWSLNKV